MMNKGTIVPCTLSCYCKYLLEYQMCANPQQKIVLNKYTNYCRLMFVINYRAQLI